MQELKCIFMIFVIFDGSSRSFPLHFVIRVQYFHSFLIEGCGFILNREGNTKFFTMNFTFPLVLFVVLK